MGREDLSRVGLKMRTWGVGVFLCGEVGGDRLLIVYTIH